MAVPPRIVSLTDELISHTAGLSDKNAPRFQRLKRLVEKSLRNDTTLRTDTFEVARRLDGLQKKFQVIGNDSLADALRVRLDELEIHRRRWSPDVLSLLLELSEKPATRSKVESVELQRQPVPGQLDNLTWADLGPSDTFEGGEDLWKDIDYAGETSDDSISLASSDVSIPRIVPQSSKVPLDAYALPDDLFLPVEDENLISQVQNAQTFQEVPGKGSEPATIFLTELQAIREVIFMLQSLPTVLFCNCDGVVEIDRRYALHHVSHGSFKSLLRSFSSIGTRLHRLRGFVKQRQKVPFMQTFQRELEHYLSAFDKYLSNVQGGYLKSTGTLRVSIIQLLHDVRHESGFLEELAALVGKLKPHAAKEGFQCLDALYDLICLKQASGEDHEFRLAVGLFFRCFEVYLKPIRLWMEKGELAPALGAFFVTNMEKAGDLRTLWHEWFALEEVSGTLYAPKFLRPAASKIFTTGKSMVFLRHLGAMPKEPASAKPPTLAYDDICPSDECGLLLSFSGLLENSFDRLVNDSRKTASSLLRTQLDEQCGLWTSLQALEYIYLGKDLSRLALIDSKVLDLIDRGSQSWNDRFLLTELIQHAFGDLSCVDSSRLIARPTKVPYHEFKRRCRSVQILNSLSIDYSLPWPVANIVTKEALASYQRLSIFLMQIRRPKHLLERQYFLRSYSALHREKDGEDKLGLFLRYRVLQFLNAIYSHVTEPVISCSSAAMLKNLAEAVDVDAMIATHNAYMSSLEDQCLLSERLAAIHDAVISILDVGIHLSDLLASRHSELQDQREATSPRHRGIRGEGDYSSDEEEVQETEDRIANEGISFLESPYQKQLLDLKVHFEHLCAFVTSGLRGLGRADGQQNWELLADRLESTKTGVFNV